ncbi:MAG: hypothetical protein MZV49_02245 [Rhodopseudomonas palustris]|nr:hypothetical protein [Rhodopseudomonas palustris]
MIGQLLRGAVDRVITVDACICTARAWRSARRSPISRRKTCPPRRRWRRRCRARRPADTIVVGPDAESRRPGSATWCASPAWLRLCRSQPRPERDDRTVEVGFADPTQIRAAPGAAGR